MSLPVLHVFAHHNPHSERVADALERFGAECRIAEDGYAAMAAMVQAPASGYRAVLVDLAALARGDREFFQLAARRFSRAPVFVYGAGSEGVTTDWAVAAGACGRVDADDLAALLDAAPDPGNLCEPAVRPSGLTDLLVDQLRVDPHAEADRAPEGRADCDDSEFRMGDIPLRREQAGALRQRPAAAPPSSTPAVEDVDSGSLLTQEELEALLGEDYSAEQHSAG